MRITFNPTIKYTPSFSAKSKEIRKADDIQRKARTVLPFFNPRYAKIYYPTTTSSRLGKKISSDKAEELDSMRKERYEFNREISLPEEIQKVINDTNRERIANCGESALITMSTLLANGYTNTHRCAVILSNEILQERYEHFENNNYLRLFNKDKSINRKSMMLWILIILIFAISYLSYAVMKFLIKRPEIYVFWKVMI